jgi:hypothetical protein
VEHKAVLSVGGLGLFKDAQMRWLNGRMAFFILEQGMLWKMLKILALPGTIPGPRGSDRAF